MLWDQTGHVTGLTHLGNLWVTRYRKVGNIIGVSCEKLFHGVNFGTIFLKCSVDCRLLIGELLNLL